MTIITDEPKTMSRTIPVSVITTCYGRNRHLYNLLSSLAQGSVRPAEIIIVNNDAEPERLAEYALNIVQIPTTDEAILDNTPTISASKTTKNTGFDIGRNRNIGAAQATYESMIFLDVDCIVAPTFIEQLAAKSQTHPTALFMGQPRYLTRPLTDSESVQLQQGKLASDYLDKLSVYNPYRYNFDVTSQTTRVGTQYGIKPTQDYGAFWSLCFAISRAQFRQIGGFDTHYVGYGAEDTDFAFIARTLAIDFYLTNDVIYHQQHSVHRPPLNHLASIVINANRFYDKWQHWPMSGWLAEFEQMQLIDWDDAQQTPIVMIRMPSSTELAKAHYPDAPYV